MKKVILLCHVVLLALLSLLTGCHEEQKEHTKEHVVIDDGSSREFAEVFLRHKKARVRYYIA